MCVETDAEEEEDLDPYELMMAVDVLAKIPKDFFEKIVSWHACYNCLNVFLTVSFLASHFNVKKNQTIAMLWWLENDNWVDMKHKINVLFLPTGTGYYLIYVMYMSLKELYI